MTALESKRLARAAVLLALSTALDSTPVRAQQLPGAIQPAPILRAERTPPSSRAEASDRERQGYKTIPAPQPGEITFILQGVELTGSTSHAPSDVFAEFTSLMRKPVALSQLQVAAENVAVRYRNAGFLLAQAFVPVQTVRDGNIQVRVLEGEFASCRFAGDPVAARSLLQSYAERLCATRPVTVTTLERYLLLMNDVPGFQAKGVVVPAEVQDENPDLVIRVTRRNHEASVGISNRESKSLGTWRMEAGGEHYGAFGLDGRQWVRYRHTPGDGLNVASIGQELPIGSSGAKWSIGLLGSRTKAELTGVPVRSELSGLNVTASYPWLRRRTESLTTRATFSAVTTRSDLDNLTFNQDRVRSARLGLTCDFIDSARGGNVIDVEVSHGLDGFGANPTGAPNASRSNGRSDYTKVNLYAARVQPLVSRLSAMAALTGQYSDQPLLVPEQFALGGEQFLRAYDAAELLGDRGYGAKVELRYDVTASGSAVAYAFYEYGRVYLNGSTQPAQDAASTGLGLRFTVWDRLHGYIEGALPLGRDVAAAGNRNPRAFGGLQLQF